MITKIISGLLGASIVLSSSPNYANTRTVWIPGKTNDGSRMFLDNKEVPVYDPSKGLTLFSYGITDSHGETRWRNAVTDWCYQGKVQHNPKTTEDKSPTPKWYIAIDDGTGGSADLVEVKADSKTSLNLIKVVCDMANYNQINQ